MSGPLTRRLTPAPTAARTGTDNKELTTGGRLSASPSAKSPTEARSTERAGKADLSPLIAPVIEPASSR
ncbi:MAG: hypothetical protein PHN49_08335, partial [Candidatus Omnitrophica bacterium]|nr:hypothetical protein [Candidatus Omnitrophota bacterium]